MEDVEMLQQKFGVYIQNLMNALEKLQIGLPLPSQYFRDLGLREPRRLCQLG